MTHHPKTDHPETELSRPLSVERLREDGGAALAIAATEAERAALARRFGALGVAAFEAEIAVAPWGPGGWRLDGSARAALTQTCVVTLEPVETRIDERFTRYYAPESRLDEAAELLDADARDELEPLGAEIDAGEVAAEAAALGVDPYPRRADAAFGAHVHGPPGVEPLTDEAARPFAKLAALKGGRSEG
jgi:uncharacterized metal-binding protein YceD (DUF177 family)